MLELKHVPLDKRLPDLLVGPRDEELVIVVGLLRQPRREIDGSLQVHSFPWEEMTAVAVGKKDSFSHPL